jgi:hypothetical protein
MSPSPQGQRARDNEALRSAEHGAAMTNIPVFTAKSAHGFHDQLLALAPDPATGKPDPAKI